MRVVAVDWSGAARGEQRHLWLASASGGRLDALGGHTRESAVAGIISLAERDASLLVGLDFAFSMPAWWLDSIGVDDVTALWAGTALLDEWLATCPAPFWGRSGRPRPAMAPERHWRQAELAVRPRPKSVFQLGGAGSVGTGSLRGMPYLGRLRAAGFSVWPFDPPRFPLVVEMWPRLFTGPVVKSSAAARHQWLTAHCLPLAGAQRSAVATSEDAFDAAVSALAMSENLNGSLPAQPSDPVVRREGWIWGVPLPDR